MNKFIASLLALLFLGTNVSKSEDSMTNQFAKSFQSSKLHNDLGTCEFKVAWDLLRDYGQIDDKKFGVNLVMHCFNLIEAANKVLSPPITISVIFTNLGFVKEKVSRDGIKAFQMYEDFEYTGEIKKGATQK